MRVAYDFLVQFIQIVKDINQRNGVHRRLASIKFFM